MIEVIILASFLFGMYLGYLHGKKNIKPNKCLDFYKVNILDTCSTSIDFFENKMEAQYNFRLEEYNRKKMEIENFRKEFYEKNPDHPCKTMHIDYLMPPIKMSIRRIIIS